MVRDIAGIAADQVPLSAVPGISWPAIPATDVSLALALVTQLEESQWWSPDELLRHQLRQATELVSFAAQTVPFYRQRLAAHARPKRPLTPEEWRDIPLLTRRDIQTAGPALQTRRPLKEHGAPYEVSTSGSTGEPVRVQWNSVTSRFFQALTLRDHLWRRRNFQGKVAVVRRHSGKELDAAKTGKSAKWAMGYPSGPMVFYDLTDNVDDAMDWIVAEDPDYLQTYPTYLRAMLARCRDTGRQPARLREVATFGEVVDDGLRSLCRDVWNADIADMYSMQEAGIMALQCPTHDHYLVQSEAVLLEIIDEQGNACPPGETGRVVVTPLHNFSTPLIRYETGDYAEFGHACATGRGLPVIDRIYGRVRNMLRLPDGGRVWIKLVGYGLDEIAAVRQFQVVQKTLQNIELRVVASRPLTTAEEEQLRHAVIHDAKYAFTVDVVRVDQIPRSPGGKLQDVLCEIDD